MSQYKRIVSYIYQYIDGEKGQNMGYLRLEQKAKQCRIVVQMKAVPVELMPQVWLYKQQGTGIEYISIGKLSIFSGSLQCKVTTTADNIFMSGHTAMDFDGAIIYVSGKEYYATTWTDDTLFIGEMVNMSNGNIKEDSLARNINQNDNFQKDNLDDDKNNSDTEDVAEKNIVNESNDNNLDNISTYNDNLNDRDDIENNNEDISTYDTNSNDNINTDGSDNTNKEDGTNSTDNVDNSYNEEEVNSIQESGDDINSSGDSDIEAAVQKKEDEEGIGDIETQSICNTCPFKNQEKINKNFGQRMLSEFPVMYPFESGCISRSVRIEPKDLGCMPIKLWAFANNRFLLHGYYCYKHLIFAGLRDGGYAIGVPGVYSESERRSASGYSFSGFQPIGPGKASQGVFGYWLYII